MHNGILQYAGLDKFGYIIYTIYANIMQHEKDDVISKLPCVPGTLHVPVIVTINPQLFGLLRHTLNINSTPLPLKKVKRN